jgi:DNA-binding NtrC family response regulator
MGSSNITTLRLDGFVPDAEIRAAAQEVRRAIYKIRDTNLLVERLLAKILGVIPAKRGAVLLPDMTPSFEIDNAIVSQARREYSAILVHSPSLVCAPLRVFDSDLGAICLQGSKPNGFSGRDLRLLAAIAADAAEAVDQAGDFEVIKTENRRLIDSAYGGEELIGNSVLMQNLRNRIIRVAPSTTPILILGPSGTGKELVALAIHRASARIGPFVPLNCSSLRGDMVESDLFGHEKGAFTGAVTQKKGQVEIAAGGTLFLDEIGELPPPIQPTTLRFLQTQEFRPVGATRTRTANVRIVAATNRDLPKEVLQGTFREDLFYRLQGMEIRTPALSEIRGDIPLLIAHFIKMLGYRRVTPGVPPVIGVSDKAMKLLTEYHWPGNIRQLQNAIDGAIQLGLSRLIEVEDIIDYLKTRQSRDDEVLDYYAGVEQRQRWLVETAMARANGDTAKAAVLLGISRSYLYDLLKILNIKYG